MAVLDNFTKVLLDIIINNVISCLPLIEKMFKDQNKQLKEVENEINKIIKNDILSTVKKGDQLNTDVLNISEKSYKYYLNHWDTDTIRRFNVHSVKQIQVKIKVEPGNYKYGSIKKDAA